MRTSSAWAVSAQSVAEACGEGRSVEDEEFGCGKFCWSVRVTINPTEDSPRLRRPIISYDPFRAFLNPGQRQEQEQSLQACVLQPRIRRPISPSLRKKPLAPVRLFCLSATICAWPLSAPTEGHHERDCCRRDDRAGCRKRRLHDDRETRRGSRGRRRLRRCGRGSGGSRRRRCRWSGNGTEHRP